MAKKRPIALYSGISKEVPDTDYVESRTPVVALGVTGTVNIDCSGGNGSGIQCTLTAPTGNVTLTVSNVPASPFGFVILIQFTQHGTTPRTLTPPTGTKKQGSAAVSSAVSKVDMISLTTFDNGTTWLMTIANDFA